MLTQLGGQVSLPGGLLASGSQVANSGTVVLLPSPPLNLVGVSIGMQLECQRFGTGIFCPTRRTKRCGCGMWRPAGWCSRTQDCHFADTPSPTSIVTPSKGRGECSTTAASLAARLVRVMDGKLTGGAPVTTLASLPSGLLASGAMSTVVISVWHSVGSLVQRA